MSFIQEFPKLSNPYSSDLWLQWFYQTQLLPQLDKKNLAEDFYLMGEEIVTLLEPQAEMAEKYPPVHIPYSAWGERIDLIETHSAWDLMKHYACQWGLIRDGYHRPYGEYSRLIQMIKLYLYHPSSALFSCPLAMTDGCARVIELSQNPYLLKEVMPHFITNDPLEFWTSGQWMTEKTGGSDVSNTETIARPHQESWYQLFGMKWFTSATTSEVALALARIEGAPPGNKGLSLFFIPVQTPEGKLNHIRIERLKNKFGTRALPTAELTLEGTPALLLGEPGSGIKSIAPLLNITRIYNTVCSLGYMARALHWMDLYSSVRKAFGKPISEHPLHQKTFLNLHALKWGLNQITFDTLLMWGRSEIHRRTEDLVQLRFLTPLLKLYTGKKVVEVATEVMEGFGGQGYIEDTPIPRLVANSHVMPIWEGTTNVLSLDLHRALTKEEGFQLWLERLKQNPPKSPLLQDIASWIEKSFSHLCPDQLKDFAFLFMDWLVLNNLYNKEQYFLEFQGTFTFPYQSFSPQKFYQWVTGFWKEQLTISFLRLKGHY
ncbi:MAG: acyl-CoA dehydrogenase family protein [Bdellovibrionaceae bacterium]|nr:acyl-CoA dehydrogenase family protein [Pseudobdellovibrionaceae bacterium]MDW8191092.1 acyl-CoA dehydrogenase family protein [Pseudobdellovibrionaceae bacterium]